MKNVLVAAQLLFPVPGRDRKTAPRRVAPGEAGTLRALLAISFAIAPLVVMMSAVAQTA